MTIIIIREKALNSIVPYNVFGPELAGHLFITAAVYLPKGDHLCLGFAVNGLLQIFHYLLQLLV